MLTSNSQIDPDLWNCLQEPVRPVNQSSSYMLLLSALDSGWEITQPVHLIIGTPPNYQWIFYFNLKLPTSDLTCQLIVEECPELLNFIYEEKLGINF
jgi:hypothetical protein